MSQWQNNYYCTEHTIEMVVGVRTVRVWFDAQKINQTMLSEFCGILHDRNATESVEDLLTFVTSFAGVNAVQVRWPTMMTGVWQGIMAYLVPFDK